MNKRMPDLSLPIAILTACAALLVAGAASGADPDRGRGLYEQRCGECHAESVHGRAKRVARDFDGIQGWVKRWNETLGLRWNDEDIDDVTVFLNSRYYRFSCPPRICKVVSMAPAR